MKQNRLFTKGAFIALFLSFFSLTSLYGQTLTIITTVCSPANEVRLTGPFWGWNPTGGPIAVSNGDGTWTFSLNPVPAADMEYLLIVDGVQENLIQAMVNGGTCAPITNYSSYANRRWLLTDSLTITNTYGQCGNCGGSTLTQMDLPVTFEGTTIEYGVIGFEGAEASTIEVDPTNATNTVVKVVKSASAQPWAGTTITAPSALGLANSIPFSASNQKMTLKVWSPDAGIPVRLKVEDHGDPTHSVETESFTTLAGQWETLTFDFANQATGTALINLAYMYDKPSVFFNYGVNGATAGEKTYYFDDLKMFTQVALGLEITVDVCSTTANEVRMTGPFWGWDPIAGPVAVNNNDGTWTFNLDPIPTVDMEYLIIVDGVQENLISDMQNGGTCAPITDYSSYANRKWIVGSGNVFISYNRCVPCSYPDIVITTEVCSPATTIKLTGPIWQWNPNFGPTAVSNGDGTYTFTISPAPKDTLEYLLVKDGVLENLIQEMVNGAGCAPITDYSTYANRRWIIGQGPVSNTYGKCAPCSIGVSELTDNDLIIYPNPADSKVTVSSEYKIEKIEVYSILGDLIVTNSVQMNETEISLDKLNTGVYMFNIYVNDVVKVVRIIKN